MNFFDFFRKKPANEKPDAADNNQPQKPTVVAVPQNETRTFVNGIELSTALSAYAEHIEKTALPCLKIEAVPDNNMTLVQSKFGGEPYWPATVPYPKDAADNPMFLLAQLNFSEIPYLRGYPESGLLQFYISTNDLYGADFNNPTAQRGFRVVYFENVDETTAERDFSFLNGDAFQYLPLHTAMRLVFSHQTDYVGTGDVRFKENFGEDLSTFIEKFGDKEDEIGEELFDKFSATGHKIGGYAYFTQEDPRVYKKEFEDWILLLQIDSDSHIMWGDVGVANFFIHPDALAKRDFSNVMYNWDCG